MAVMFSLLMSVNIHKNGKKVINPLVSIHRTDKAKTMSKNVFSLNLE